MYTHIMPLLFVAGALASPIHHVTRDQGPGPNAVECIYNKAIKFTTTAENAAKLLAGNPNDLPSSAPDFRIFLESCCAQASGGPAPGGSSPLAMNANQPSSEQASEQASVSAPGPDPQSNPSNPSSQSIVPHENNLNINLVPSDQPSADTADIASASRFGKFVSPSRLHGPSNISPSSPNAKIGAESQDSGAQADGQGQEGGANAAANVEENHPKKFSSMPNHPVADDLASILGDGTAKADVSNNGPGGPGEEATVDGVKKGGDGQTSADVADNGKPDFPVDPSAPSGKKAHALLTRPSNGQVGAAANEDGGSQTGQADAQLPNGNNNDGNTLPLDLQVDVGTGDSNRTGGRPSAKLPLQQLDAAANKIAAADPMSKLDPECGCQK
ncbi:unnamed protein product [Mycena citricolor]|uniref:Uncharacterized protein n=1 Tax=Mycena citricolor TaxID=2018698 RepID=A0AAD2Q325_9AGAR|nr:unnamed protein product [Mycena citricolor]